MWWEKGGGVEVLFWSFCRRQSAACRALFVLSNCTRQASTLPPPFPLADFHPHLWYQLTSPKRCSNPTPSTHYHPAELSAPPVVVGWWESGSTSRQPTGDTSLHRLKEYKFHRFFGGVNLEVDWSDSPSQTFSHHALTLLSSVHWQSPHSASRVALIL